MLFLHGEALREFGGHHGVRDENLLASALDRARGKFHYGTTDLCDLAAAYAHGIARNHAFFDGNKRTAWASCVLFLKANGLELSAPALEIVETMVALATGTLIEADFGAWLRGKLKMAMAPDAEQSAAEPDDCMLVGRWRITGADLWDSGYLDLCGPAYLEIAADGNAELTFGALTAGGFYEYSPNTIWFGWQGSDEGTEISGEAWVELQDDGAIEITLEFDEGDEAVLMARRA